MAWRLRFLRCDFRFGSQVGDERSGHQSDISVVEIIALPKNLRWASDALTRIGLGRRPVSDKAVNVVFLIL